MRSFFPSSAFLAALLARGVLATDAAPYTDGETGISFLGYTESGYRTGIALPSTIGNDMIVQVIGPIAKGGWTAVDFGNRMVGPMIIAAWGNANDVIISPRMAVSYKSAPVYTATAVTITPIPLGTYVNETHVSATFLCGSCLNVNSFNSSATATQFSYGFSNTALSDPSQPDVALNDHTISGNPYGAFNIDITGAQSSQYDTWAAMASASGSAPASGAPPTSSTSSAPQAGTSPTPAANPPPAASPPPAANPPPAGSPPSGTGNSSDPSATLLPGCWYIGSK